MFNRIKSWFDARHPNHKDMIRLQEAFAPLKPGESYGWRNWDDSHPNRDIFTFEVRSEGIKAGDADIVRLRMTKKGHQVTSAIRYPRGNSVGAYDLFKEV